MTTVLNTGIQKLLSMSQTLYNHPHRPTAFDTMEVVPSMYTERRVVVEDTQPKTDKTIKVPAAGGRTSSMSSSGSFPTSNVAAAPSSFSSRSIKVVEHAPGIFHNLRMLYGVQEKEVAASFATAVATGEHNLDDGVETMPHTEGYTTVAPHHHNPRQRDRENSNGEGGLGGSRSSRSSKGSDTNESKTTQKQRTFSSSSFSSSSSSSSQQPEKSAGKSLAVFIKSKDEAYLLKTLNDQEKLQLLTMLEMYYGHMHKYSTRTLLPWFLGEWGWWWLLLFVVVCWLLVFVVVCWCWLLFVAVCCCLLLVVVVCCWLFGVVGYLLFGVVVVVAAACALFLWSSD